MMDKNITTLPEKFLNGIATNYHHILKSLLRCCHRDDTFIKSFQGETTSFYLYLFLLCSSKQLFNLPS